MSFMEVKMKKQVVKILACLLPLILGCTITTPFPTPTAQPPLHFENELVSFDYPAGATIFTPSGQTDFHSYAYVYELGGDLVVGLANPGWMKNGTLFSSIGIYRHALPPGSSLEQVMQAVYVSDIYHDPEVIPEQSGPFTVDGRSGVRITYKDPFGPLWYTWQDIWLEADGSILRISLIEEVVEGDFQEVTDLFLTSLDIKDNLPAFTPQPTLVPTATPTPTPTIQLLHFENELLAFDYPQTLVVFPAGVPVTCFPDIPFAGERLVGLGEARFLTDGIYYRSIQVTRLPVPPASNLEAVMQGIYDQSRLPLEPPAFSWKTQVPVAGQTGIQRAYRVTAGEPAYELRDIWLQMNDQVYIISVWSEYTNATDFFDFQIGAELLLDSLVIK
jgi:hypothetical protein